MQNHPSLGADLFEVSAELATAIALFQPNVVTEVPADVSGRASMQFRHVNDGDTKLYGLRLVLRYPAGMAHSGWLNATCREACRRIGVNPLTVVSIYTGRLFEEFEQFSILSETALFLGVGSESLAILDSIADAERGFDPRKFDADGYLA